MNNGINYPRVLVISHNAFSLTSNNGKTYSSIFTGWPKDKIAQLYFQNEIPDFSVCNNFFYMTDEDMVFKRKEKIGRKVDIKDTKKIKKTNSPIHTFARNRPLSMFTTFRNIIWSFRKWDNINLSTWIEEFLPEVIFFVGGGSTFSYNIANRISNKYSVPIYLYYTDDYITPISTLDLFWWINLICLRKTLKKTLLNVNKIFVIGEDMAIEYKDILKKPCIPIMNAVDIEKYSSFYGKNKREINSENQLRIAYFGGLHLNRWESLAKIGEAIKELSKENMIDISLSIYSGKRPNGSVINAITDVPYIQYVGCVNENEIIEEMGKYDILIHVESFDKKMKYKTRLSISTKIPEYLASGKPILAVGPDDISSIRYLKRLGISYIINSLDKISIKNNLIKILNEKYLHKDIGLKGIKIAKDNHSIEKNRKLIRDSLSEVFKRKKSNSL